MPNPITRFDNLCARAVLAECEEALRPIAEKYGLVLDNKGRSYGRDALPVMFQFLVKKTDNSGNALSADAQHFQRCATLYGLKPEDLGRTFTTYRGTYRIRGCAPRSTKYQILAEDVKTGKLFKFPSRQVVDLLQKETAA